MGGNVEYPLLDALGSVRQLTSNTGVNLLKRSYTADGSIRFSSGSGISRLGFAGELQDTTTGIVYLRARHYNPALGRFLQRDSFGGFAQRPQSLNRYSYAENNAVNYTDPSGHFIDTVADGFSIGYDIAAIVNENILNDCGNLGSNLTALALDSLGFAIPAVTGLGFAYRAGKLAGFASKIGRWAEDFRILRKTGIWGGTLRKMIGALEKGEALIIRTRPFWAGVWETLGTIPKPSLGKATPLFAFGWKGTAFDSGLRWMKDIEGNKIFKYFVAHSDNDLNLITKFGIPITPDTAREFVAKMNKAVGGILQHTDVYSGLQEAVEGSKKADLYRRVVMINWEGEIKVFENGMKAIEEATIGEGLYIIRKFLKGLQ